MRISDWSSDVCSSDLQAQVTLEADLEAKRLSDAAEATGIKEKIDALPIQRGPFSMKRYFALHPKWTTTGLIEGRSTIHPVIFFLNPAKQDQNNYGWFTVEELDKWLTGKMGKAALRERGL